MPVPPVVWLLPFLLFLTTSFLVFLAPLKNRENAHIQTNEGKAWINEEKLQAIKKRENTACTLQGSNI